MSAVAHRIQIIRALFPETRESDLVARLEKFNHIANKNKEVLMGKNKDYKQGYTIGEYLSAEGEDLDFKDLDQIGNELFEENPWGELPVNDLGYFKDGLSNGYVYYGKPEKE
ncbi:MAG: hypothetical protein ACRDHW_00500 [Ktedonobacteraceae bacterium]